MTNGLEKNWWDRVYYYSSLYDFDGFQDKKKRTSAQKFILQGKSALIRLMKMNFISKEEAEWISSTILTRMSPKTMNGAAVALVCTTYDMKTKVFLYEPDPNVKGSLREIQKRKCWKTLIKTLSMTNSPLSSFQQEYGIIPVDLLRYFIMLRNGNWGKGETYYIEEEED